MDFESDEQRKAVMAKLYYSGLLYDSSYFEGYDWSQITEEYESKQLSIQFREERRKRLEQIGKELDLEGIKKKIEVYQDKCQKKQTCTVINEIKQILSIEEPKEYEAIKLLSLQFNNVIKKAVQADIDRDIISFLREKQQQLVPIITKYEQKNKQIMWNSHLKK